MENPVRTMGEILPEHYGELFFVQIANRDDETIMHIAPYRLVNQLSISIITSYPIPDERNSDIQNVEHLGDQIISGECINGDWINPIILRDWRITDLESNIFDCQQTLNIVSYDLEDLEMPKDITLDCFDNDLSDIEPELIIDDSSCSIGQEYSSVFCDFIITYEDAVQENCGEHKVFRTWTIINPCAGNNRVHTQRIDILDLDPPIIPKQLIVDVDAESCVATNIPFEMYGIYDECSELESVKATILVSGSPYLGNAVYSEYDLLQTDSFPSFHLGKNTFSIIAEDKCGNEETSNFDVIVEDIHEASAICKDHICCTFNKK